MYTNSEILDLVNEALATMPYDRKPQRLYEPMKYVLSLGGKRIRPVLMLMAYNLYREDVSRIMNNALAIETYHNYTLLHDDLMDRADVRRGKPCVHKVWDDNTAILSGDAMLVFSYRLMADCPPEKLEQVMGLYTETALQIGEGQQYDMEFETRNDVREEEYIEMIRLKTSVLLACALKLGAVLADAPQSDADALYAFGEKMGLAFQLQDDYLDVYGDFKVFGKKIGGDILCNKKTFMLINALAKADGKMRKELERWLEATDYVPEDKVAAVTRIYNELNIPQLALDKINSYFEEAKIALESVQVPDEKKAYLWELAEQMLGRKS